MIDLIELDATCHPAFEQLLNEAWAKNWDDEVAQQIVQWRYYDRPGDAVTWLAVEEGQCVAMLDSMLRPYLLDGERILVRETADWYCTPNRRSGVGLWLLRQLALHPDPVIVLGGSSFTISMLPKMPRSFRMTWAALPAASVYVLPIRARGLAANLIRQRWWQHEKLARVIPNFIPVRRPKPIAAPAGVPEVRVLTADDAVTLPPPARSGLVQLLEPAHWQWLAKMPHRLAQPIGLLFLLNAVPIGVSFSQIEPAASGLDARIVHLQCADALHTSWVISETAQFLTKQGVGFIRCCVSSDDKIKALKEVGFVKSKDIPCHWLPNEATIPASIDVGYLRGDDAMPFQALRGRHV